MRRCYYRLNYSFSCSIRTALHFACARGHDGMVRVICQNGASPNIEDGAGKRPLHKVNIHSINLASEVLAMVIKIINYNSHLHPGC